MTLGIRGTRLTDWCPACEHPLEHHGVRGCRAVTLRGPGARAFQAENVIALVCGCELSQHDAEQSIESLRKERARIDREIDQEIEKLKLCGDADGEGERRSDGRE